MVFSASSLDHILNERTVDGAGVFNHKEEELLILKYHLFDCTGLKVAASGSLAEVARDSAMFCDV